MTEDERKAGNRRATIHFWSRRALYSLSRVYDLALDSSQEAAAHQAWHALDRLMASVEADAAAADLPLERLPVSRSKESDALRQEHGAQGGRHPAPRNPPVPARRMTFEEFTAWEADEPDMYELVDGVPVRVPDEKQGARRIGRLFAAAALALGGTRADDWVMTPLVEFGGARPLRVASRSWLGLIMVIEVLRRLAATTERTTDDNESAVLPSQTLVSLLAEARRMADIERARAEPELGFGTM
jgi:hypothetical protein